MPLSNETRASLVAICLRSGVVRFESEAARILAVDLLDRRRDGGRHADNSFLFDLASTNAPTSLAADVPCLSVNGPPIAGMLWGARSDARPGNFFKPPAHDQLNANGEVVLTAAQVWSARVSALSSDAAAVIAAATSSFDLAGTVADLLALDAMNPAADPAAWSTLYTDLFGEEP